MNKLILELIESIFGQDSKRVSKHSLSTVMVAVVNHEKKLRQRLNSEPNIDSQEVSTINAALDDIKVLKQELVSETAWEQSLNSAPSPSSEQFRAIANEASLWCPDISLSTDGVKQCIAELQSAFERDNAEMAKYFPTEAKKAFIEHGEKLASAIIAGSGVESHESWTLSDWEQDFAQKLSSYKTAIKRHSVKAFELVKPRLENLSAGIGELACQMEQNERTRADVYLIPFTPSPVLALLRKAKLVIENRIKDFNPACGESPRDIASILG